MCSICQTFCCQTFTVMFLRKIEFVCSISNKQRNYKISQNCISFQQLKPIFHKQPINKLWNGCNTQAASKINKNPNGSTRLSRYAAWMWIRNSNQFSSNSIKSKKKYSLWTKPNWARFPKIKKSLKYNNWQNKP